MRRWTSCAVLLALAALCSQPAPAGAVTRGQLTAYVDRVAMVWAGREDRSGAFLDPQTGRPQGGYGNVMIGYGLLRTGARRHDERLVRAGVRGVDTALGEPVAARGVFDLLSMAAAYNYARTRLAHDSAFAASRPRWERYLRQTGAPNVENKAQACIVAPDCFHTHEAVGAAADLELLATALHSRRPRAELKRAVKQEVAVAEPSFATTLLSDTGVW